ncbi:hypothetical protein LOK49_LG07G00490 [Camellia lanceoleosa]|uniref:Uncharacterized protein n=1 Tax=Camellia lanceoleosa TaxID=1840588 RepID=A0ACC0H7V6_9ERIC|nr:hypothetical protein LOK49_LG07G00490 [Camellia lanceoleosa]
MISVQSVASSSPSAVAVEPACQMLSRIGSLSLVSSMLACQWGDEGKGKLVDILAKHFDIVARSQLNRGASMEEPSEHVLGLIFFTFTTARTQ